ncbi:MAG: hypothetical protein DMF98_11355 [Acidobacteria bacterium]|nr:MAG: hypothetical protein DMF98_11355 [Acidobacteriota bacterium]
MTIMKRLALGSAVLMIAGVALLHAQKSRPSAAAAAGNGTLIIGAYPKQFWIIDEATEKIVGTIPFQSGIPRRTALSRDRKRFYTVEAAMEKVEILDIAARKTVDTFGLSEGNRKVRIRSVEPDPLQRFVMMVTASATKLVDRFEVGSPTLVQYDLKEHRIVRTIPWPNGEERQNANIQFSPDGKLMYLFTDQDVLIYETSGFTQVDKWELSKPIEEGFGRLEMGSRDVFNDEPGFYTGIFSVSDPVQHRRMMGIARVNLAAKTVDFYTPSASRWRRTVRSPTACSRISAGTSSGSSTSSTGGSPAGPSSKGARAWGSRRARMARCCTSTLPGTRLICMTPTPISTCARSRSTAT